MAIDYTKWRVGNTVTLGTYPHTEAGTDNTPIEWLVLAIEEDKAFVLSKYALDCVQYNTQRVDVTWETSSIREWLNHDFYDKAFSAEDRQLILSSKVTVDKNFGYSIDHGNDTTDNVYLLSVAELFRFFIGKRERLCVPTDYAKEHRAIALNAPGTENQEACWWWLRSIGDTGERAVDVANDGSVNKDGYDVDYRFDGLRPCMWIRLF